MSAFGQAFVKEMDRRAETSINAIGVLAGGSALAGTGLGAGMYLSGAFAGSGVTTLGLGSGGASTSSFGASSLGSAQWIGRLLQRGGHTVKQSTANALNKAHNLNLHRREWGRALEDLKTANFGKRPNFHDTDIYEGGQVMYKQTLDMIDNLLNFLR
jgi:hypothetical protein